MPQNHLLVTYHELVTLYLKKTLIRSDDNEFMLYSIEIMIYNKRYIDSTIYFINLHD